MARFTNQAQLRYGNAVTNSNIAVGEILEVLSAKKTAVRSTYGQKDTVTYIVSIVNAGTMAFNNLTLTDNLGAYEFGEIRLVPLTYVENTVKYYSNGVLQTPPAVTAEVPLTLSGISIPAGGNVVIVYETEVNTYAPREEQAAIVNTATISGTGISSIAVQETVTANREPVLTITKSVSPVPVTENGTLTYTFLIQNTGNIAADEDAGAVITDDFDPILSNLAVSFNGTPWTEPLDYTYDEQTGAFATNTGKITVPAATYTQNEETGAWTITPGVATLVVTGTI